MARSEKQKISNKGSSQLLANILLNKIFKEKFKILKIKRKQSQNSEKW